MRAFNRKKKPKHSFRPRYRLTFAGYKFCLKSYKYLWVSTPDKRAIEREFHMNLISIDKSVLGTFESIGTNVNHFQPSRCIPIIFDRKELTSINGGEYKN